MIALQGLFRAAAILIADLLCAAIVVPVLLGLWQRMTPMAAIRRRVGGLVGAVLPGWIGQGSVSAGVMAATFPGSVPTLGPFVGALLLSTTVSVALALV
ncbi:sodium:solute symporter, partial [Halomonas sp. SUBG004]